MIYSYCATSLIRSCTGANPIWTHISNYYILVHIQDTSKIAHELSRFAFCANILASLSLFLSLSFFLTLSLALSPSLSLSFSHYLFSLSLSLYCFCILCSCLLLAHSLSLYRSFLCSRCVQPLSFFPSALFSLFLFPFLSLSLFPLRREQGHKGKSWLRNSDTAVCLTFEPKPNDCVYTYLYMYP